MLYDRLDTLRDQAVKRLAATLVQTGGTPQARSEREIAVARHTEQLAQFDAGENGLCFGRLDFGDGERRYIGRLGIFDESADYEPLLVDWRAPAARPFYLATAAKPDGVRRRRQIRTAKRIVVGLDDEVLDLADARPGGHEDLVGEARLLAAVATGRTGRMGDIVETIQAEQDRIIRSDHRGVLVVQGGPGTGKTAVALHRAAYLLYTFREQLSKRGVLIVGPNSTFLRYIGQVLPSLGETGVVLSTVGDLFPGVHADRVEPAGTAEIKGRPVLADVLAAAIRDRQVVPDQTIEIVTEDKHAGFAYQRETLRLHPRACRRARDRARRSARRHNHARPVFVDAVIDALAREYAARIGGDPYWDDPLGGDDAPGEPSLLDETEIASIRSELDKDAYVAAAIDELWPVLTPQQLLSDLYASADRLATAAPMLTQAERAELLRPAGHGWSTADVPLLDEAAELLGEDNLAAKEAARRRRREREAFAQGVLDILSRDVEDDADPEILMAYDMLDAQRLAERQEDIDWRSVAERAAADRHWAYGHVIVDEAQELSSMAWRMLMRRCPSRSMTIVGDVTQTGDLAGTLSWGAALRPYLADRWRLARLSVNYRTPAEIMEVAADVVAGLGGTVDHPRSVRHTGVPPWRLRVPADEVPGRLAELVAHEAALAGVGTGPGGEGRLAVITAAGRLAELETELAAKLAPALRTRPDPVSEAAGACDLSLDLDRPVAVMSVKQAKGLEFDSVIVVDPDAILAESPRGRNDLYVAMTRATQRLGVVYCGTLPPMLAGLRTARPYGEASQDAPRGDAPQEDGQP